MKNRTLKDFKSLKITNIEISKVHGGWKDVISSGPGSMAGIDYTSDYVFDDNGDGKWGPGESMVLINAKSGKM